jgi:hypothetical protein
LSPRANPLLFEAVPSQARLVCRYRRRRLPRSPAAPLSGREVRVLAQLENRVGQRTDRNAEVWIMHGARCLSRRIEKGRAYGVVTAKALAVLEALLWAFHNVRGGLCFPSYEKIAEAAGCARSPIARALKSLESCGILSWVHRLKRVREPGPDLLGDNSWRWRVLRTPNAYDFRDPDAPNFLRPIFSLEPRTKPFSLPLGAAFGGKRTTPMASKEALRGKGDEFRSATPSFEGRALSAVP